MTETKGTATWPQEDLARIGSAGEIGLASRRQRRGEAEALEHGQREGSRRLPRPCRA
jgi:hypothetical protein